MYIIWHVIKEMHGHSPSLSVICTTVVLTVPTSPHGPTPSIVIMKVSVDSRMASSTIILFKSVHTSPETVSGGMVMICGPSTKSSLSANKSV